MGNKESSAQEAARLSNSGEPEGFHQAMAHLYRGEMQRMTVWRSRLDTTSNWAILLSTGMATFALGSPNIPHFVLLLGLALIGICILIEARRYRHLLHTKWRLHMLEAHYFARQLCPSPSKEDVAWREELARDLKHPCFTTGTFMALRLRLRRNYLLLVYFVSAVWLTKVFVHPGGAAGTYEFYSRLGIGELLPSWFVAITAALFVVTATVLAFVTPSEEKIDQMATRERRGCP